MQTASRIILLMTHLLSRTPAHAERHPARFAARVETAWNRSRRIPLSEWLRNSTDPSLSRVRAPSERFGPGPSLGRRCPGTPRAVATQAECRRLLVFVADGDGRCAAGHSFHLPLARLEAEPQFPLTETKRLHLYRTNKSQNAEPFPGCFYTLSSSCRIPLD